MQINLNGRINIAPMKKRSAILFSTILMCVVGLSFIFSAFIKLTGIDEFELYLFSQRIIGFDLSTIAARLIISGELILGIMLITGLYHKSIRFLTLGVLMVFSLFLVWKLFAGSYENCHCFGPAIDLKPGESLIKNAVLMLMVFISGRRYSIRLPKTGLITAGVALLAVAIPLVLSPPDIIYNRIYRPVEFKHGYERLQLSERSLPYNEGRRIILFFSPSCPVCRLAAKKAVIIAERTKTADRLIFYFFGSEEYVDEFRSETGIAEYPFAILPTQEIIEVTNGFFPTILFLEDGVIKNRRSYRDFSEADFMIPDDKKPGI